MKSARKKSPVLEKHPVLDLDLTVPQAICRSNKQILKISHDVLDAMVKRASKTDRHLAIVFDIDGTAIYNNKKNSHRQNDCLFKIYQWALRNDIAVFFLTARPDTPDNRNYTVNDLANSGYNSYKALRMRPTEDLRRNGNNYSAYKAAERVKINQNYNLLMSFGDTLLDMTVLRGRDLRPINDSHDFISSLNPRQAYLLVLPNSVPLVNIKLKAENP